MEKWDSHFSRKLMPNLIITFLAFPFFQYSKVRRQLTQCDQELPSDMVT